MRFGIRIPPCDSPSRIAATAKLAEACGFVSMVIPDSPLIPEWRDVYLTLAVCSLSTKEMRLGVGVTNPITRHASVTASSISTIDEISGGRAFLGIGSGYSSVRNLGIPKAPVETCKQYALNVRKLLAGELVRFGETTSRLGVPRQVPIYLAASGPRMLQLAGEIADGVLINVGTTSKAIEYALKNVRIGLTKAGRHFGDMKAVAAIRCILSSTKEEARLLGRPIAAHFVLDLPELAQLVGISLQGKSKVGTTMEFDFLHSKNWDEATVLAKFIDNEVVEKFCIIGTPEECAEQIAAIESTEIQEIIVETHSSHQLPSDIIRAFGEKVIPAFQ